MPEKMPEKILELLDEKKYLAVKEIAEEMNTVDLAELIEELYEENEDRTAMMKLFRLLPKEAAADVFSYLDADTQQLIIETLTDYELRHVLEDLYLDDCVDMIEEMPANVVKRVLKNSSPENRQLINQYLKYPEDSAGSIMTNEYVGLKSGTSVKSAFDIIRRDGVDKETIYTCYVTDASRRLIGYVTVREMLLSPLETIVDDIMETHPIYAHTLDDKEEIAKDFSKYDMLSMPVVDNENRIVGIITIDDAVDVMQDENTEDFEKMALLLPSEDSYLKTGIFTLYKNRIVWLLILMVSATFTGQIIEGFEDKLSMIAGLTASIPMLMDTGGNCGNQVSTLVIRGLALGDINIKDFFKIIWKEIRVAVLCGLTLAVVNYARMWIIKLVTHNDISSNTFIVVCLAMICAVIVAKVIGCALPILAKLLHLDPALMAGPMITTIVDALTLLIYFGFATLFINGGLLV